MWKVIAVLLAVGLILSGVYVGLKVKHRLALREARRQALEQKYPEIQLTFLEGWTVTDMAEYLAAKGVVTREDFIRDARKLDISLYPFLPSGAAGKLPEGYLFPDTYRFAVGVSATDILEKMLDNFSLKLEDVTGRRVTATETFFPLGFERLTLPRRSQPGLSLHELLTLASIVEKESSAGGGTRERKIIAGIFYNRLAKGHALESDATVGYVTKSGRSSATLEETAITSPYNTYKYPGLPPGPICNPSLESIRAAFEPEKTEYLYFLHKQPSGEVYYARTLEEHNLNKAKYLH